MSSKTTNAQTKTKAKPALHIQVGGIRIPIWQNEGKDGPYFKAGQPEVSYKDGKGRWQTGNGYGHRDLVNLIKAASLAHSEISRRNRTDAKVQTQDEGQ
jgi:hypothetical protein